MTKVEESYLRVDEIVNGIDPSSTTKLDDLKALRQTTLPLLQALSQTLIDGAGSVVEIDAKSDVSTMEKAARASIRARRPRHDLQHLRDFLRFRSLVRSLDELVTSLGIFLDQERTGAISIVKIDYEKFCRPNPYGWRMIACDLRFKQTGLIVEHYMTFGDIILVSDLLLHRLYRNWRNRTDDLTMSDLRQRSAEISVCATTNYAWFTRSLSIDPGEIARVPGSTEVADGPARHPVAAARDAYDRRVAAVLVRFERRIRSLIDAHDHSGK